MVYNRIIYASIESVLEMRLRGMSMHVGGSTKMCECYIKPNTLIHRIAAIAIANAYWSKDRQYGFYLGNTRV